MRKVISVFVSTIMFFSAAVCSFGSETNEFADSYGVNIASESLSQSACIEYSCGKSEKEIRKAEQEAEIVENITGTENVQKNIKEKEDVFEGTDDSLTIARLGGEIEYDSENGEKISMQLPVDEDEAGYVTDSGTVVYEAKDDAVVSVQLLSDEDTENDASVRSLITIQNAKAADSYDFIYDLPENTKLSFFRDLDEDTKNFIIADRGSNEISDESIFIVDSEGGIYGEIEPAWAKDANGNAVETYYEIDGSIIRQYVNFTEESSFPIVADPAYRLVYKRSGTFKIVGYTAVAAAAAFSAYTANIPAAALTAVAAEAIKEHCEKIGYTIKRYTCNMKKVTYTKTYLKIWNTKTRKTYSERTYYTKKYKR